MNPLEWLDYEILGNSLLTWGSGLAVVVAVWTVLALARRIVQSRLAALATRTGASAFEIAEYAVGKTRTWFLLAVALYAGSRIWTLGDETDGDRALAIQLLTIAVLIQAGLWTTAAFARYLKTKREQELESNPGVIAAMDLLSFVAQVAVWSIVLLLLLDNLGFNITGLVAGLGVGGIAIALAAQNILGDLFASLSIILDKPFVVGDFLIVDNHKGTVERVGIKTTRIRSLWGEQLVFSNNDLLSSRIQNLGRMVERRIVFSVGITYQTPADKLAKVSEMLQEAVEAQQGVRFDRAHFFEYGNFSLNYEIVYYVLSPLYDTYMDIQQAINIAIFERFAAEGIEFAYPTQTLFVEQDA